VLVLCYPNLRQHGAAQVCAADGLQLAHSEQIPWLLMFQQPDIFNARQILDTIVNLER
jgi:hypothetical protein